MEHMTAARGQMPDVELVERHLNEDVQGVELESARIVIGVGKGLEGRRTCRRSSGWRSR